ncbi:hypothetical protein GCM10023066_12410 [Nocardioides kongjuensis]
MLTITTGQSPASAATIPDGITSMTTTASQVEQWDEVDFTCTWAVPDYSQPGDTFTLKLPAQLRWFGAAAFDLRDPDGTVVATALADASGLVTFTLSGYASDHPTNLHGACAFSTQYVEQTTTEQVDLQFDVGSSVIHAPISTTDPCTDGCGPDPAATKKYSWWHNAEQSIVRSVITAPAMTAATSDVTVTDTPGPGLALDCATVAVKVGTVRGTRGFLSAPFTNNPATITCTAQQLTVTLTGLAVGEIFEVWVDAHVIDPSRGAYTNQGTVTINGAEEPVTATERTSSASGTGQGSAATPTATPTPTPTPTSTATPAPTPTLAPSTPAGSITTTDQASAAPVPKGGEVAGSSTLPNTGSPLSPALILFAVALLGAGGVLVARSQRQAPRKSRGGVRCPPRG